MVISSHYFTSRMAKLRYALSSHIIALRAPTLSFGQVSTIPAPIAPGTPGSPSTGRRRKVFIKNKTDGDVEEYDISLITGTWLAQLNGIQAVTVPTHFTPRTHYTLQCYDVARTRIHRVRHPLHSPTPTCSTIA